MPGYEVVRYQPGQSIDTRKPLEVIGPLADKDWGAIEEAYPEVAATGGEAEFRRQTCATIFPPQVVFARLLKIIVESNDGRRTVYPYEQNGQVVSALVHVHGGYASLHIYRLRG